MYTKEAGVISDAFNWLKNKIVKPKEQPPVEQSVEEQTVTPEEPVVAPQQPVTPEVSQTPEEKLAPVEEVPLSEKVKKEFREWLLPLTGLYPDGRTDISYNALSYLKSLGYRQCIWRLGENHAELDICDDLNSKMGDIDLMLFEAQHTPPSPIFTKSHPGCRCFLSCFGPQSPFEIPDSAPGLPLHGTPDEIQKYKELIFPNLVTIDVDSQTLPPLEPRYANYFSYKRFAKEEWKENVCPVITITDFILLLPLDFYRPMITGMKGFQLETSDKYSKVYFVELNRVVKIPTPFLEKLELVQSDETDVDIDDFVHLDYGSEGIVFRKLDDGIYCYVPEFDHIVKVESCTYAGY